MPNGIPLSKWRLALIWDEAAELERKANVFRGERLDEVARILDKASEQLYELHDRKHNEV